MLYEMAKSRIEEEMVGSKGEKTGTTDTYADT
jgi:hypothetical protein